MYGLPFLVLPGSTPSELSRPPPCPLPCPPRSPGPLQLTALPKPRDADAGLPLMPPASPPLPFGPFGGVPWTGCPFRPGGGVPQLSLAPGLSQARRPPPASARLRRSAESSRACAGEQDGTRHKRKVQGRAC